MFIVIKEVIKAKAGRRSATFLLYLTIISSYFPIKIVNTMSQEIFILIGADGLKGQFKNQLNKYGAQKDG